MTAKEKAKELVDMFHDELWEADHEISKPMLKQCALIAVNEILKVVDDNALEYDDDYWNIVKSEIEKL